MLKVVRGKKGLINETLDHSQEKQFNCFNENFHSEYKRASFFDKIFLKKNLHFVIDDEKKVNGYVWLSDYKKTEAKIKSLFIEHENEESIKAISHFLNKFTKLEYVTSPMSPCNEILKRMGFTIDSSIVDMEIELRQYEISRLEPYCVRPFKVRSDEWIRAEVQNSIFYSKKRTPLTVSDVELDMLQEYYLENGSYFLTNNGKIIGYGQLILMGKDLFLVNFGIMYGHRNKGLGKYFLKYLLNKGYEMGFDNMKIKVFKGNDIALKLYKDIGFEEKKDAIYWIKE